MVYWQKFDPKEFEFEFNNQGLAAHSVSVDEALEVISNRFDVRRNKRYQGGYQIVGHTDAVRRLNLLSMRSGKG